jgi:class 3 adenylate cyclase
MESKRQLAAIMFTDICGYTALMGENSIKALELVRINKDIEKPLVEKHNGKWLKEMGDGAMAQFGSALDAVNCAIEIQEQARSRLDGKLRIGIHLGDITIENEDIYGDGVNVASRLESICDPGGIYISQSIQKSIKGYSIATENLGDQRLKNVEEPLRVFAVQGVGLPKPKKTVSKNFGLGIRSLKYMILILLLLGSSVAIYLKFGNQRTDSSAAEIQDHSLAVMP